MGRVADLRMKKVVMFMFMLMGVAALQLQSSDAQTTHVVLDSMGWTIPQSGAAAYTTWASSKTFAVGDVLLFNFPNGAHNVAEVSKAAFDGCTTTRTLSLITQGPANITLNSAGNHYFICAFPGHCTAGQKLAVTVSSATATPPTASPPTSTNTPSSPSPVDGTAPPPPNSAASFAGLPSWFTYVALFMALLFNRNLC